MHRALDIGIIGYGRMGKMVEQVLESRGHRIAFIVNRGDEAWSKADVAIEFTTPDSVLDNIKKGMSLGLPLVTGTTGWHDHLETVGQWVEEEAGALFHASNFSLGVNLFFQINQQLAELLGDFDEFDVRIEETHHTAKLDHPSGTAITTAQGIIDNHPSYGRWEEVEQADSGTIPVKAFREEGVVGTHKVIYEGEMDRIELSHQAKDRKAFAIGAVRAAEFLVGRQGIFGMTDLLNKNESTT